MSVASLASYTWGQCTWGAAQIASWIPSGWGNADQWLSNAVKAGYPTSTTAILGSVAVWMPGMGGAGSDGHVAVVTGIQGNGLPIVTEMNWNGGVGVQDTRNLTAQQAAQVAGYILPQGASVPSGSATQAQYAQLMGTDTSSGSPWYDNIPVVGGIINGVTTGANVVGWVFDKVSDPATYLTLAWLGVAAFLVISGVHMLTGFGKGAGQLVAAAIP